MRNLKRALSLAMASIMVIGMMVVGAGAVSNGDFSDKDKIVNTEAVSVLTTLNVIAGRDDGSFDPTGVVTRGEMAKMLCVVLNGGKDPQLGNITANFADTKGHWAEAYIAYCANLNIIAGRGNGNFEPNATVTGAEAAKMLLVALGYNASVEGYVGANWQINVDVAANQKGLYSGLGTLNTTTGLTRDGAAQMVYNALDIKMVEYSYVITGTADNSLTTKPQVTSGKLGTLLYEKFNAIKVEGVVVGNEYADMTSNKADSDLAPGIVGTAQDAGKTKVVVTNDEDQSKYTGTQTFNVASGLDTLGRNVSLFVKVESSAAKAQVIGSVIVNSDNKVVTDFSGDSINDVADDNNMETDSKTMVARNYASLGTLATADAKADSTVGVEKVVIDYDNDGKVDYVLLNTTEFGKVTKYSTADKGSITVSLASGSFNATKSANVVGFEDVKKDDYVIASYIGGKLHVAVAETVTGNIEAYKNNSKNTLTTKLTVDGTEYTVAATNSVTVAADEVYPAKALFTGSDKTALDTQATFYLDANGYIVARGQVVESAYNYALVKAADDGTSTVDNRVRVVLPDGKTGVYTLSDKSTVKLAEVRAAIASDKTPVFAYSLTNDNKEIKLTKANATVSGGSATFEKGKSTITISGQPTQYATNSTVFYYVGNDGTVNTYTGRNAAPSVSKSTSTAVYKNNAGTVVAVVFGGVVNKTSVGDHMFVYSVGAVSSNYTLADVVMNGKDEVTKGVKIDANSADVLKADTLFTYTVNSDGYYELSAVAKEGFYKTGVVSHAYSTSIVVDNGFEAILNSSTVVIDNHDTTKTPTVAKNGNINKGDTVEILVNDTDKAVMVVITKLASGGNDSNNDGSIIVDGSEITGTAMSAYDSVSNINAELRNNNVILDGSIAAAGISIPTGKTLVVKGNLDATASSLANSGTVIVTGTYKVKDNENFVGNVQAGTLALVNNAVATGNVTVSGNVTGAANGVLSTVPGKTLKVGGDMSVGIYANGPVDVRGSVNYMITADNGAEVIVGKNLTGAVTLTNGNVTVKGNTTGTVSMAKGNLTVGGTMSSVTSLAVPSDYTLTTGGDVTTSGAVNILGTAEIGGKLTTTNSAINVGNNATSGNLTADALDAGTATITLVKGNLTVAKTVNATQFDIKSGSVSVVGATTAPVTLTGGTAEMTDITGNVAVTDATIQAGTITGTLTLNAPATGKSTKATVKSVTGTITDAAKTELTLTDSNTLAAGTSTFAGSVIAEKNLTLGAAVTIAATSDIKVQGMLDTVTFATTLSGNLTVGDLTLNSTGAMAVSATSTLVINGTVNDIGNAYLTGVNGSTVTFGNGATVTAATSGHFMLIDGVTAITPANKTEYQGKTFVHDGTNFIAQS